MTRLLELLYVPPRILTGVTVRKRPIWVKIGVFCPVWPWNLKDDLEKQFGTSPMLLQAFCIISSPYMNSNWSYSSETAKLVFDLCDLDLWPLTLTFCMGITSLIGNHSWKFHDDTIMGTWWKRRDRQTDGRTGRGVLRAAWSQLKYQYMCGFICLQYMHYR